jgi:DNA-directed RNA polymerase subunit M/transcription elongation factor TFIIS
MKILYCSKCGTMVATLEKGSTIKHGTVLICKDCDKPKTNEPPGFLRDMFGMKK